MARNSEKAMAMLNRYVAMKQSEGKEAPQRRPYLATECDDLAAAERWRHQIIREIAKKVSQIQNAGLGEFRIRDLNDEINKLLREKRHWEDRIIELGGPNYFKVGPKMLDHEGKEIAGNRGYKYFGASRDLPGVRELFEQEAPAAPRKTRGQLNRLIDTDYYGYRDDEDGTLEPHEREVEEIAVAAACNDWKARHSVASETGEEQDVVEEEDIYAVKEDMEALLVKRKKMELLEKYASESLQAQNQEAKALLGLS
ncbi:pre-mRNA-splicing factor ISY1 homolog isoform X2 [Sycon ciliatum]|uniref:pre-mRNA-splicing factor ISY1 homolog isoform X2 n=1 Tax=Sycon ciliatum TaxID=27933 RepID=UPI0031F67AB0